MKSYTLEWNAVITLENPSRFGYVPLKKLVDLHGKAIDLGIATTAASENTKEQQMPETAAGFKERLNTVGLSELSMVLTAGVFGLSYFGLCRVVGDDYEDTVAKLWRTIKPVGLPRSYKEFAYQRGISPDASITAPEYQKWRNKWCDVHSLEAHISAGRDAFVTGDVKNFRGDAKKKLEELGVGQICSYDEAFEMAQS